MLYRLTIGRVHVWGNANGHLNENEAFGCKQAWSGCRPPFVFSVPGQVAFRKSLSHLDQCGRKSCRRLRSEVYAGICTKLSWLMSEDELVGCVQVQPLLYGATKVILKKKDFSILAHHLANCPRESCAQLRRAVLLTVRTRISPRNIHRVLPSP